MVPMISMYLITLCEIKNVHNRNLVAVLHGFNLVLTDDSLQ